jgi:hypothetical protein
MKSWGMISPFAGSIVMPRLAVLALIVLLLGVPINDLWRFLLLTVAVMAVCFGRVRLQPLRWLVALAVALVVAAVSWLLPGPRIEEGHNVYIPVGASLNVFENDLPPDAQRTMLGIFDRAYLQEGAHLPGSPAWWNDSRFKRPGFFAQHAFAPSADALWQRPKYSRTVDVIDFRSQDQARLDVINRKQFNFHPETKNKRDPGSFDAIARIKRTVMPFFVMVEINPAMVGGTICWRGDILWEKESGRYDLKRNDTRSCSDIGPQHVGKHVFALAITPDAPRDFAVQPNELQRLGLWFKSLVRTGGVLLALFLLLSIDTPGRVLLPAAAIVCTVLTTLFYWHDLAFGFRTHDGGNDGLTHESMGFDISQAVAHGDLWTALRGGEGVFYFMPGLRYFRAAEDFLFGSTGFGMVLCTMFIPIFLFLLMRRLLPLRWCVVLLILFLFVPILERFGFAQFLYVREMWKGFPEPIGYGVFVGALALIASFIPTSMGPPRDGPMPTFWVGLALAVSIAARPNLAIAAALVLAMLGLWLLMERRIVSLAGLAVGFAPVLFITWHNWYFGGAFVPLTSSASSPVNLVTPPSTYLAAFGEMLRLDFTGPNLSRVITQIGNWNHWTELVRVIPALVTLLVLFQRRYAVSLRALALVAVSLQAILFFYNAKGRYSYLAWLLVFLVFVVALRETILPWLTERFPHLSNRVARWPRVRQLVNFVGLPP